MAAVARMYESKYFSEKDIMDWEKKPVADQNWAQFKRTSATFTKTKRGMPRA